MKNFKLKKLVVVALAVMTIATVSPVGASAAWKQDSKGWWNAEESSYSIGWRTIDSSWYYFSSEGYMKTGWVKDNETWYYLQPSGAMKTGWINDRGIWYYLQQSGAMKTGWVKDNGTWYYLQPSGAMKTGWINDRGTLYFANSSGVIQTGVVEINKKVYYFAATGAMVTGNVTINGVTYTFAATGEAIGDKIPTATVAFSSDGVKETPSPAPDTTTSSSHHNSSGSTSYVALSQAVIDAQYKSAATINNVNKVVNADGTTTIKPILGFTPGSYNEIISKVGERYTVTKDVYVTLNGKDAYISGDYTNGYTIEKGATGTVTITASISVYDSTNSKLYYVTPSVTTVTIK